jgi:hypothetical protein
MKTEVDSNATDQQQDSASFLHVGDCCLDCGSTQTLCGLPIDGGWDQEDPDAPAECVVCADILNGPVRCAKCKSRVS